MKEFSPERLHAYRDRTHKARMIGCMTPTFQCKKCGQHKKTAGRKMIVAGYPKAGYHCKDCVSP